FLGEQSQRARAERRLSADDHPFDHVQGNRRAAAARLVKAEMPTLATYLDIFSVQVKRAHSILSRRRRIPGPPVEPRCPAREPSSGDPAARAESGRLPRRSPP